jgi:hypothetical protein
MWVKQTFVARAQRTGSNDTTPVRQTVMDTVLWGRLGVPMDIAKGRRRLHEWPRPIIDGGVTAT